MFIISEIFPQHSGDLARAEQMILQSKLAGAGAVKVQLYAADMFPTADGTSRAYLELDLQGLERLKGYADRIGIDLFATPFDEERLGWCVDLDLKYLKVAARMHREQKALAESILAQGRPAFVSVPHDLDGKEIVKADHATYLYCIPKYPTRVDEVTLPDFRDSIFDGLSDHSIGVSAALMAAARGATVIEKHFTVSHTCQVNTEQAHLGAMTMEELGLIQRITTDFQNMTLADT